MIRFGYLFFLVIALALAGCPRPTTLVLQNRSGHDALIQVGDFRQEWKADAIVEVPTGSRLLEWRQDGSVSRPWLVVLVGRQKLSFLLNYVLPQQWIQESVHRLELRSDWGFYFISPDGRAADQPVGFPIRAKG